MSSENVSEQKKQWFENPVYVILWLIFFFPVGIYGVWKYPSWSKRTKWILTALPAVFILWSMISSSQAAPVITMSDAQGLKTIENQEYKVEGKVTPTFSKVKVNGNDASVNSEGKFSYTLQLKDGNNDVEVVATNAGKDVKFKQVINKPTAEEITKRKADAEASAKVAAEKKAQEEAQKAESTKELDAEVRYSASAFMIKNKEDKNWTNCKFVLNGKLFGSDFTYKTTAGINAQDSVIVPMNDFTKSDGTRFNPYTTMAKNLFLSCDVGSAHRTGYYTISQ